MEKLRIVSQADELFLNRAEVGLLLARELETYQGKSTLVLGIPGGGVVVAYELAFQLDAVLDIILSRKIGAPHQPELAVGAVSEDGSMVLNKGIMESSGVDESYISEEKARQLAHIEILRKTYRQIKPAEKYTGKNVIVTNDGVATGATMEAALWMVRKENPRKLVAALPVGPRTSLERLSKSVDEIICLRAPKFFYAIGQFYREFHQLNQKEILDILKKAADDAKKRKGE